ncbi:MAG: 3'-5' exonuclease, partial [Terriglobales bacterium]
LEDRAKGLAALPVPESGAVKVMTIHQAKGLEFATVILPQLDRFPGKDDPPLLAWQELPSIAGPPADLLLAPIHGPGEKEPTYEYLRHLARRQREQESVRLLYVAATRAKHRLYLLGGWKPDSQPDRRSLAALLCPQGVPPAPAIQLEPSPEPAVALPAIELRRLPAGWHAPAPPPAAVAGVEPELESGPPEEAERPSYHWVRPLARHVGVVVHAWLAAAAGLSSPAPWPASVIRGRLAQEGVAAADLAATTARAEQAIARVLADERGRWLLALHEDDQREWALAGVANAGLTGAGLTGARLTNAGATGAGLTGAGATGATATASPPAARHIRIDRSFVAQGQRWIADYKLSVHEGGDLAAFLAAQQERYRPQLETYAALLAAANLEPHPVRLGLYFPLVEENGHPAWRSWSWPRAASAPGI